MPAQIHILSAGAVQPGLSKVIEIFRRESGDEVIVSFATAPAIAKRIAAGEIFDIAIAPQQVIEELATQEKNRVGQSRDPRPHRRGRHDPHRRAVAEHSDRRGAQQPR